MVGGGGANTDEGAVEEEGFDGGGEEWTEMMIPVGC